ncbi:hypothetical protein, partial [Rhizobium laguerreae]|uniref:hypothetical protein n=1 Tax=Rhizobium laguerreae TaxID=1076926 RepID=UPI001C91DD08
LTKIIGKRSRHSMLASTPASILNHKTSKNGIPADSTKSGYALGGSLLMEEYICQSIFSTSAGTMSSRKIRKALT